EIGVLAKLRLILVLERERNLERMAGRRLVQRESGEVVQRTARQVVRVEQIKARAAAACRVERRQIIGHGLDGETRPRQKPEELRCLAVEALRDPRGPHQEFL